MSVRHDSTTQTEAAPAPPKETAPFDTMGSSMGTTTKSRSDTPMRSSSTGVYAPRSSVGLLLGGVVAVLLSAWAGIVPFIGPTFGFSADGSSSWRWNEIHAFGALAPGAVGVLAGLLVLANARPPIGLLSASTLTMAGLALFLCGAWLVVAPVVWPVIVGPYFLVASNSRTLEYWLAYASGPGVLLASFGGYVLGRGRREARWRRRTLA